MNKLDKIIKDARAWVDEQYQLKGGNPGTDIYYKNQHRARVELLNHIEASQQEKRDNGQLQS